MVLMMTIVLKEILTAAIVKKLDHHLKNSGASGLEAIVQDSILSILSGAKKEVPLSDIGALTPWDSTGGRIDIVADKHGIEIKVIEFPHVGLTPSNSLYDIGQISSDYWRIKNAEHLDSGELILLLRGPLVSILKKPSKIGREFHNRMFLDFKTSLYHGELSRQKNNIVRQRQISAIKEMGFDFPAGSKINKKVFVEQRYAIISVPVVI